MNNKHSADISNVRIIGGNLRSRKVIFQQHEGLRPTADRVRETLFNWLQNQVAGATCLDLYAGSGALGFEALSRGASSVIFVESNRGASRLLQENLSNFNLDNGSVICQDASRYLQELASQGTQFDIVFLDPPFTNKSIYEIFSRLVEYNLLHNSASVYIEIGEEVEESKVPSNWAMHKSKRAGSVYFYLFKPVDAAELE